MHSRLTLRVLGVQRHAGSHRGFHDSLAVILRSHGEDGVAVRVAYVRIDGVRAGQHVLNVAVAVVAHAREDWVRAAVVGAGTRGRRSPRRRRRQLTRRRLRPSAAPSFSSRGKRERWLAARGRILSVALLQLLLRLGEVLRHAGHASLRSGEGGFLLLQLGP